MNPTMRVNVGPVSGLRSRTVAKASSIAVVGLVCFVLGFVALHQQANLTSQASVPVQARKQLMETQVVSNMVKLEHQEAHNDAKFAEDLKNLVQDTGAEVVSRKQLHEVSDKIAIAVRASHNTMDVRKLIDVGTVPFCGPKKPPSLGPKRPPRPCVPRPSTPPVGQGICKLCVVYTYPITDSFLPFACGPTQTANILLVLNSILLNGFPALFNQIGGLPTNCSTIKIGQQNYAVNGPYCAGPVDPKDYPAIEATLSKATEDIVSKMSETYKYATTSSSCESAVAEASTTTVVGQDNQELEITLVCDDGLAPAITKTFTTSCPS